MARPLRIEFAGARYHLTGRGNERRAVCFTAEERETLLGIRGTGCNRFKGLCQASCLMTTHYHAYDSNSGWRSRQG